MTSDSLLVDAVLGTFFFLLQEGSIIFHKSPAILKLYSITFGDPREGPLYLTCKNYMPNEWNLNKATVLCAVSYCYFLNA